jgi:hypothetical protein
MAGGSSPGKKSSDENLKYENYQWGIVIGGGSFRIAQSSSRPRGDTVSNGHGNGSGDVRP